MGAYGTDSVSSGIQTTVSGKPTTTIGAQLLEKLGVPGEYSELAYSVTMAGGSGILALKSAKTGEELLVNIAPNGKVIGTPKPPKTIEPEPGNGGGKIVEIPEPPKGGERTQSGNESYGTGQRSTEETAIYGDIEHVLDGGLNHTKRGPQATGGHLLDNPNMRVDAWTRNPDANGVAEGSISIKDPDTGNWVKKGPLTTFFPKDWTREKATQEIESAFKNRTTISSGSNGMWEGISNSGVKIRGYYGKKQKTFKTAWPVIEDIKYD